MKNEFEQTGFSIELTKDGSPTLRLPNGGESMHHSGGAASETLLIYQAVIERALAVLREKRGRADSATCIVGLGMGYIEISWAQTLLKMQLRPSPELHLTSFEVVEKLRTDFTEWLNSGGSAIYDEVCQALQPEAPIRDVKGLLNANLLRNPLEADVLNYSGRAKKWNIVCYDAFSSKTNQELWTEEFLDGFIKNQCADDCVFTTYACRATLRNVLIQNGFTYVKRPGFQGKRNSTLAFRGVFNNTF